MYRPCDAAGAASTAKLSMQWRLGYLQLQAPCYRGLQQLRDQGRSYMHEAVLQSEPCSYPSTGAQIGEAVFAHGLDWGLDVTGAAKAHCQTVPTAV